MESLHEYIKTQISDCYKIVSIKNIDSINYRVEYIDIGRYRYQPPQFTVRSQNLNLRVQIRDSKIEELLNSIGEENSDFDVEDIIYSEEEREKLHQLRNNAAKTSDAWTILRKVRKEYSESFQLGDNIHYNGGVGFITFKHADKDENDITRWSVKIGDTEFRYVNGTQLLKRKVKDLSHIEIDPELNKLSTEKLLKIYKRRRDKNQGVGNVKIKRILQEREHIQKGPNKIVIKNS